MKVLGVDVSWLTETPRPHRHGIPTYLPEYLHAFEGSDVKHFTPLLCMY
jgi:hypothetical protein